jgi:Mrp family chromosome partitioning ATPase
MNDSPLARYLVPVRRWWWVILALVLAGMGVAWITMPEQLTDEEIASEATRFRATHLLIRNDEAPAQLSFDLVLLLAEQGDVENRVITLLGDEVPVDDVRAVTVEANPTVATISITAVARTPDQASTLASTFAQQLVAFLDERTLSTLDSDLASVTSRLEQLEAEIDQVQTEIEALPEDDLDRRLLEAELNGMVDEFARLRSQERSLLTQRAGVAESFVTLQEPSPVPADAEGLAGLGFPTAPATRLPLAALLAAVLGIIVALSIDYLEMRIRTRRQAEDAFGLPVLAEIPSRKRREIATAPIPAHTDPGGIIAEVLRSLRLSIQLAPTWHLTSLSRDDGEGAVGTKSPVKLAEEPRSLVVTSPLTGDGKSSLVANLAASLAEGGKRVLVVDCDFRRPAVGALLDIVPGVGLRELAHATERPLLDLASPTVVPNVAMVRSGSRGVTPSWFMAEAGTLVAEALEIADIVLFDTGPITLTNEASALLPHVDTSIIVARAGRVATDQARATIEHFTQVDARVSGIVLVGAESRRRYGYGYYHPHDESKRRLPKGWTAKEPKAEPAAPEEGRDPTSSDTRRR